MSDELKKYAPVPGKIPGRALNLGGVDFVVAPMNLDGLEAGLPLLARRAELADQKDTKGMFRLAAEFIQIALSRNNPDITIDDVVGLLDMANVEPAIKTIAEASGLEMAPAGEQ